MSTEKQELIKLVHKDDPKAKVSVNDDHAQAYLDSGYVHQTEAK